MRIKDRPEYATKAKPMTFSPGTKVSTAVSAMTEKNYGSAVIVDKSNKVVGIMTERDLMTRLVNNKMDPDKTKVSDIMTSEVRVANENDNMIDWLRIMSNERFRHLPIVDEKGKIVNMMSQGDFVSYTWPELLNQLKVTTKATIGAGYQIFLIILAMLAYALILNLTV